MICILQIQINLLFSHSSNVIFPIMTIIYDKMNKNELMVACILFA